MLLWTGSEYGVAWRDHLQGLGPVDIYFALLDASGGLTGVVTQVTDSLEDSLGVSMTWTGSEFGIGYNEKRDGQQQVFLARLDAAGDLINGDIQITTAAGSSVAASVVWAGSQYGVAWYDNRDGNNEIYFARLDASGNKFGSDVRVTAAGGNSIRPSLVWTGSEFAVAWYDDRFGNNEIFFTRIDASGVEIGDDVRVTVDPGSSRNPSLVWADGEFGIAWQDDRDGNNQPYFTRMDASGNKIGDDVKVRDDIYYGIEPSLVRSGIEYGLAWADTTTMPSVRRVGFTRLDVTGNGYGKIVWLTAGVGDSENPALVWSGTRYGVAWQHENDDVSHGYFAQIACGCGGFTDHSVYGRLLFQTRCTQDAGGLVEDVYDSDTVGLNLGANDTFYLSADGMSFVPLVVADWVDVDGQDSGLGPYADQPGVPPYNLDVPVEYNLVPLPAHDITGLLSSGANPVLFELVDTDRNIYGHTPVYLVRDCGVSAVLRRPTTFRWHSHDVEVEGSQSDLDVVSGLLSDLQTDHGFSNACFLVAVTDDAEAVDTRRDPPSGDGYYYLVSGTCAKPIGYGNSSSGPRGDLGGAPSCF
jgi:hypothetical protein